MKSAVKRVVKLGGSLLDLDDLPCRLSGWLARQSAASAIFVVGGGAAVERIRRHDANKQLGETAAHWLAVEAMSDNAAALAARMPDVSLVADRRDLDCRGAHGVTVFDPLDFLRSVEPTCRGTVLPRTWDATSDSIAARLAAIVEADELVLLKSATPGAASTYCQAAALGYVDRFFPRAAACFAEVRCVNLRGLEMVESRLMR